MDGGSGGKNMNGSGDEARESCKSWYRGTDMATGEGGAVGKKVEGEATRSGPAKISDGADNGTSGISGIPGSRRLGEAMEDLGEGKDTSVFRTKLSEARGEGGAVPQNWLGGPELEGWEGVVARVGSAEVKREGDVKLPELLLREIPLDSPREVLGPLILSLFLP